MNYDAAYLAASMIEHGTPWNIYCEVRSTGSADGYMIWMYNEDGKCVDVCMTPEYAAHLFHGKAMI